MVIVSKFKLIENLKRIFFVRSGEQNLCPCCNGALKVIGSRNRKYIDNSGEQITLVIRRLRCCHCGRIHHELPNILIPFKRHCSDSMETVVAGNIKLTVAADETTLWRWRVWFQVMVKYFCGCLMAIIFQSKKGKETVEESIRLSRSPLQRIWYLVGDAPGWLAKVVRLIANLNF
jgi:hypothetical protein